MEECVMGIETGLAVLVPFQTFWPSTAYSPIFNGRVILPMVSEFKGHTGKN